MTIRFDVNDLLKIFEKIDKEPDGYCLTKDFFKAVAKEYLCSPLAVRNFVLKNTDHFDLRHGYIRGHVPEIIPNKVDDVKFFEEWVANREKVIDECVHFLSVQTPNPYIENILVQLASTRENLKNYDDSKLFYLLLDLKRDYNFTPQTSLIEVTQDG